MADDHFRRIELHLPFDEFHRLPRNSAYKYEYFDGRAVLSPRPKCHRAVLDLQPLTDVDLSAIKYYRFAIGHVDGAPAIVCRADGDRYLLVEYGPNVLDFNLRFRVHALEQQLREMNLAGIIDITPGIRSLHIHYDSRLHREELLEALDNARLEGAAAVKDGHFDDERVDALCGDAFRKAGLDVDIAKGTGSIGAAQAIGNGQFQFGLAAATAGLQQAALGIALGIQMVEISTERRNGEVAPLILA